MTGPVEEYRRRVSALAAALERGGEVDGAEVRAEIIRLTREIDETLAGLQAVRESLRPVARRYRDLFPRRSLGTSTRADHLGGSTYRERGWSALAAGDYGDAIANLERAAELDPGDVRSLALLAWAHLRRDDPAAAIPLIDRAREQNADAAFVRLAAGVLSLTERRFALAEETLSALAGESTDPSATAYAHLYLGRVYQETGRPREAQAEYRRALEAAPNLTEAYWELGRSHHLDGRVELALEAWRAGGENRYNVWGERCRESAEAAVAAGSG